MTPTSQSKCADTQTRLPYRRLRFVCAVVLCISWLLSMAVGCAPKPPPGGDAADFCKGDDDCNRQSTCLNQVCVAKTVPGDLPWSGVGPSECIVGEEVDCKVPNPKNVDCVDGTRKCEGGKLGECIRKSNGKEVCDGKDNDCDGEIDEGFTLGGECSDGVAACQVKGTVVCTPDHTSTQCSAKAGKGNPETCDGIDNDCDGEIDEDALDVGDPCNIEENKGACRTGKVVCRNKELRCVQDVEKKNEGACNGIDDDCNGQIDDNCSCQPNEVRDCYDLAEGCKAIGDSGKFECKGLCKPGTQTCTGGYKWGPCNAVYPSPELCDGLDNDCDGSIDRKPQSKGPLTRLCYQGVPGAPPGPLKGECRAGEQTCVGKLWGKCQNEVNPKAEACNNKDDNCDGQIDEIYTNKGTACHAGVGGCRVEGKFACTPDGLGTHCPVASTKPGVEICNGKDDDCDGKNDNVKGTNMVLSRPCSTGNPGCTAQQGKFDCKGLCKAGIQLCKSKVWGSCDGQVIPQKDDCDGKDNDCNGQIDDNSLCVCVPGESESCFSANEKYKGIGTCKAGKRTCKKDFKWGPCNGEILPTAKDVCNGKDTNCNGFDDDLCPCKYKGLDKGVCKLAQRDSQGICQAPLLYRQSELCDGLDHNCNGDNYDGFDVGKTCTNGIGACNRRGVKECKTANTTQCDALVGTRGTEKCDSSDSDCDGKINEICGPRYDYMTVSTSGGVLSSRGSPSAKITKDNGAKATYVLGDFTVNSACTTRVLMLTPTYHTAAMAMYSCSAGKFTIKTFTPNLSTSSVHNELTPQDMGFHIVSPNDGTYGIVGCNTTSCSKLGFATPSSGVRGVTVDKAKGLVSIFSDECKDGNQPIFVTLFGRNPGYVQARAVGPAKWQGTISTGRCEVVLHNDVGQPTLHSFAFWLPPINKAVWAKVSTVGGITKQVKDYDSEYAPWSTGIRITNSRFDGYIASNPAWTQPLPKEGAMIVTSSFSFIYTGMPALAMSLVINRPSPPQVYLNSYKKLYNTGQVPLRTQQVFHMLLVPGY